MKQWLTDNWERAKAWNRERKERAEAARATRITGEHGHGRFFLLHVPAAATICAAFVEWFWALLFCIEATGRLDWNWETSSGTNEQGANVWNFAFSTHWPVFLGLVAATVPIVMISMVWLPVQFSMRGFGRWRRGTVIACGLLANVLVIVSGTVVMNYNRQEQVREAVVIEQTAAQGRAAIDARLAFEQEQLRLALSNSNPYLNQAANVGAEEWERSYVAQARASNDPRLPMLERALGAARAADQRRANIERLTVERATAAPEAASAANVEDTVGRELNTFAQYVEVWRPPFVAFICTLIGIFGAWWTLAMLERLNPRDVLRSGWADDKHRIEDLRAEPAPTPQPMKPPREVVTDAETGEELVKVKPHWRKLKKGRKHQVDDKPDAAPDETGVTVDGGGRIGSVAAQESPGSVASAANVTEEEREQAVQRHPDHQHENADSINDQPDLPELTPDEAEAYEADLAAETAIVERDADHDSGDGEAPDQQDDQDEPPRTGRELAVAK